MTPLATYRTDRGRLALLVLDPIAPGRIRGYTGRYRLHCSLPDDGHNRLSSEYLGDAAQTLRLFAKVQWCVGQNGELRMQWYRKPKAAKG